MAEEYDVTVIPIDCISIGENEIKDVLRKVLYEFNISQININIPAWVNSLDDTHWLKQSVCNDIEQCACKLERIKQIQEMAQKLNENEFIYETKVTGIDLGTGCADIEIDIPQTLFYRVIAENTGVQLENDGDLIHLITTLSASKQMYDRFADAMKEAEAKGYGIVTPGLTNCRWKNLKLSDRVPVRRTAQSVGSVLSYY